MKIKSISIPCSKARVDIDICLKNGQAFRWRKQETINKYNGFISNLPVVVSQSDTELKCEYDSHLVSEETMQSKFSKYFYLNSDKLDLSKMETDWKGIKYKHIPGCSILKQEPFETIISFICSQNNNISRITSMIDTLCETYGEKVEFTNAFCFPTAEKLMNTEDDLRNRKFGYRAKYISKTAEFIHETGGGYDKNGRLKWIENLKTLDYPEAKQELLRLPGVGPKVADCICLFSLEKHHVVPIDTHVWQIAVRDFGYKAKGTGKGLTKTDYDSVQNYLFERWGENAGWLQQLLFTKEIKADSPNKRKTPEKEESSKTKTSKEETESKNIKVENKLISNLGNKLKIKTEITDPESDCKCSFCSRL